MAALVVTACASGAACGARTESLTVARGVEATGGDASGREHASDDEGGGREREGSVRPSSCPSRFGELGPSCQDGTSPGRCDYPEGSCGCATPSWCGGAYPPPMPLQWICRPSRPPCAGEGTPCGPEGAFCQTDDCGFSGMRCRGGAWHGEMGPLPP